MPDWQEVPAPVVSSTGTRFGFSNAVVQIPYSGSNLPSGVQSLVLEYRNAAGGAWRRIPVTRTETSVSIPGSLPDGRYEIRFGFVGANGDTAYNYPHSFVLLSQGNRAYL